MPLMYANYAESGLRLPGLKFKPAAEQFFRLNELGFIRCYTVRDAAWKLLGYSLWAVSAPLNHADALFATCHVTYVIPERRGIVSGKFMYWVEVQLEREGVTHKVRQENNERLAKTYRHLGYVKSENCWVYEVKRGD